MPMPSASWHARRRIEKRYLAEDQLVDRIARQINRANANDIPDLPDDLRRPCPKCEKPMAVRTARTGRVFWGCKRFPICHGSAPIDQAKHTAWLEQRRASIVGIPSTPEARPKPGRR